MIAAVGRNGPHAPWVLDGPMDGDAFRISAERVLAPTLEPTDIVIMDNLSVHKDHAARAAIAATGVVNEVAAFDPERYLCGRARAQSPHIESYVNHCLPRCSPSHACRSMAPAAIRRKIEAWMLADAEVHSPFSPRVAEDAACIGYHSVYTATATPVKATTQRKTCIAHFLCNGHNLNRRGWNPRLDKSGSYGFQNLSVRFLEGSL